MTCMLQLCVSRETADSQKTQRLVNMTDTTANFSASSTVIFHDPESNLSGSAAIRMRLLLERSRLSLASTFCDSAAGFQDHGVDFF